MEFKKKMNQNGRIVQISVSHGGVPKLPVDSATVGVEGIVGDWQQDRRHHGGPTRALCLYSMELIEALRAEGHPIAPGTTGENVTVEGIKFSALRTGDRLALGDEVVIEITQPAAPCRTIRGSFCDEDSKRISNKLHPGWSRLYASIVAGGVIKPGDAVQVLNPVEYGTKG